MFKTCKPATLITLLHGCNICCFCPGTETTQQNWNCNTRKSTGLCHSSSIPTAPSFFSHLTAITSCLLDRRANAVGIFPLLAHTHKFNAVELGLLGPLGASPIVSRLQPWAISKQCCGLNVATSWSHLGTIIIGKRNAGDL